MTEKLHGFSTDMDAASRQRFDNLLESSPAYSGPGLGEGFVELDAESRREYIQADVGTTMAAIWRSLTALRLSEPPVEPPIDS